MAGRISVHEGVIRPGLVSELETFRAAEGLVGSYYLNLGSGQPSQAEQVRIALKDTMARQEKRIDELKLPHAVRQNLRRDCELVNELAHTVIGQRHTLGLACFVSSGTQYARAFRLPWPVRDRVFFEEKFVLWPLQQLLEQSDRYGIILTDKDDARLFLYFLEEIEEITSLQDEIPGRVRYPDPFGELEYMRKNVEYAHHHFVRVSATMLRHFMREPFEHLIIGGLWETLPEFESRLHRYLRDRIIARWDIDVHTPTPEILERARNEEEQYLKRQAQELWKTILDQRPRRGLLGPDPVFAALWERRVQSLLLEPGIRRSGFRCSQCGRLSLSADPCDALMRLIDSSSSRPRSTAADDDSLIGAIWGDGQSQAGAAFMAKWAWKRSSPGPGPPSRRPPRGSIPTCSAIGC